MFKLLIMGAGIQGRAAAYDLLQQDDVEEVCLADVSNDSLQQAATFLQHDRLKIVELDISNTAACHTLMSQYCVCISAVPYRFNLQLATLAVEANTHFLDLGGNNGVVAQELALNSPAKAADVLIIPDTGLAPGMVSILVADGLTQLPQTDSVRIRVGGLPAQPQGPLRYMQLFNIQGLINEYKEAAVRISDGRKEQIPSLEDIECLEFPPPFATLEAFTTSGGTSTLPDTYGHRLQQLDYKTIRYPGHAHKMQLFRDLGFFAENRRYDFGALLETALPQEGEDVTLVRVDLEGAGKHLRYQIIDYADGVSGLSSMMRCTAFPVTIIALMIARNQIEMRGAIPQEQCVPSDLFLQQLAKRNIKVQQEYL